MTSTSLRVARRELGSAIAAAFNFMGRLDDRLTFSRASGATVFAPARYSDNSVVNGDFATGLTGWSVLTGCTIANVGSALQITATATNGGATSADFAGGANKMFRTSIRNTGANAVTFYVRDAAGTVDFVAVTVPAGATFSTTILCTVATLNVRVFCIGAAGTVALVDDVVVQELTIWQPGMPWLGPELVSNGDFSNGTAGWSALGSATLASSASGGIRVTSTGAVWPLATRTVDTVAGRLYTISVRLFAVSAGTTNGAYGFNGGFSPSGLSVAGTYSVSQFASGAVLSPIVGMNGAAPAGTWVEFDDISVREQLYTWQQVMLPANVPRFAYDPVTYAPMGLLVEPQRTNLILNSEASGGAAGVAPTGWGSPNNGGLTTTVIGVGVESGMAYLDIRFSGTTSNPQGANLDVQLTPVAASANTTYTISAAVRLIAGAIPGGSTVAMYTDQLTAANAFIIGTYSTNFTPTGAPLAQQRRSFTFTTTPSTGKLNCRPFWVQIASGVAADFTLRVAIPQLEAGTEPSSYVPTQGAAATRAADDQANLSGAAFTALFGGTTLTGAWTFFVEFTAPSGAAGDTPVLTLSTDANNRIDLYLAARTNGALAILVGGSVVAIPTGIGSNSGRNKMAMVVTPTTALLAMNGTVSSLQTFAALPAVNKMQVGMDSLARQLGGTVSSVRVIRRAMSPAELQALTR